MELGTRKREPSTPLAMRLSVWLLFLIVAAFFYFDRSPIPIESEPIPFKPYEIKRVLNADVVVVVDYESIRALRPVSTTEAGVCSTARLSRCTSAVRCSS